MNNDRYLFRGKRIDNGEWVQGFYALDNNISTIIMPKGSYWYVDPATVGQCTGLRDKNNTLIFEGDIVEVTMPLKNTKPIIHRSKVFWDAASWRINWKRERSGSRIDGFCSDVVFEIIGNVHDNPELLEEGKR